MIDAGMMRRAVEAFASGCAVYVLMVACSSASEDKINGSGGAGGIVPDAEAQESGTRLKARHYTSADGAKQFAGWRDTTRNVNCLAGLAEDGKIRCLPNAMDEGTYEIWYSDAGCLSPVLVRDEDCAGQYIRLSAPACVGLASSVYEISSAFTGGNIFRDVGGGTCDPATAPAFAWNLKKVFPEDFAEFSESVDQ